MWIFSIGGVIRYHGTKPKLSEPHVFVSNHTSFVDYFLISSHLFPHATVAQSHGGLFGILQRNILSLTGSLSFQRSEKKDRSKLVKKMKDHVSSNSGCPLIIFPEGTCVNNEYTVLFHKGAFELGAKICPVAIKYNKRLVDPYWNTKEQTFTYHMWYLMTRWLVVADVWWLQPEVRYPLETSIEFASRVKAKISAQADLKNLSWDGYMKNFLASHDHEKLQKSSQEMYFSFLKKSKEYEQQKITKRSKRANSDLYCHLNESEISNFPSWIPEHQVVDLKNSLIISSSSHSEKVASLINNLIEQKEDVVNTWKKFTKLRNEEADWRRVENSSWRLWFKQQNKRKLNSNSAFFSDEDSVKSSGSQTPIELVLD